MAESELTIAKVFYLLQTFKNATTVKSRRRVSLKNFTVCTDESRADDTFYIRDKSNYASCFRP